MMSRIRLNPSFEYISLNNVCSVNLYNEIRFIKSDQIRMFYDTSNTRVYIVVLNNVYAFVTFR